MMRIYMDYDKKLLTDNWLLMLHCVMYSLWTVSLCHLSLSLGFRLSIVILYIIMGFAIDKNNNITCTPYSSLCDFCIFDVLHGWVRMAYMYMMEGQGSLCAILYIDDKFHI